MLKFESLILMKCTCPLCGVCLGGCSVVSGRNFSVTCSFFKSIAQVQLPFGQCCQHIQTLEQSLRTFRVFYIFERERFFLNIKKHNLRSTFSLLLYYTFNTVVQKLNKLFLIDRHYLYYQYEYRKNKNGKLARRAEKRCHYIYECALLKSDTNI